MLIPFLSFVDWRVGFVVKGSVEGFQHSLHGGSQICEMQAADGGVHTQTHSFLWIMHSTKLNNLLSTHVAPPDLILSKKSVHTHIYIYIYIYIYTYIHTS